MQVKGSSSNRLKPFSGTSEWSSGQKWGNDAPKDDVDSDAVSIMSSGSCGAFVHGLEDEYLGLWIQLKDHVLPLKLFYDARAEKPIF